MIILWICCRKLSAFNMLHSYFCKEGITRWSFWSGIFLFVGNGICIIWQECLFPPRFPNYLQRVFQKGETELVLTFILSLRKEKFEEKKIIILVVADTMKKNNNFLGGSIRQNPVCGQNHFFTTLFTS